MLKPDELETEEGRDIWETLVASSQGDVVSLQRLIDKNPVLSRAEFWYTPAIHFAVREGHVDAVRLLLEAGADPERNGLYDGTLIEMAKDRGHAVISDLLELERDRESRHRTIAQPVQLPIHAAAAKGDIEKVIAELDADPTLIHAVDRGACTLLHRALLMRAPQHVVTLLLDRGADLHARRGGGSDLEPIDMSLWGNGWQTGDVDIARLLISRGATCDLAVASALGEFKSVRQMLDAQPERIREARPSGRRPLSAAIERGHYEIARLLLDAGLRIPPIVTGCQGYLLHNAGMLRMLLKRGMNPNLMNWEHQTLLHMVSQGPNSTGSDVERAAILLDAGADINAREDAYRSTPLGWAARRNAIQMVEFLLTRGAASNLPDDEPWATPLSWAQRRGHAEVATILRRSGATA